MSGLGEAFVDGAIWFTAREFLKENDGSYR